MPLEHIRRLADVIVHADQHHVIHVHVWVSQSRQSVSTPMT
jgi:hypothetical protein